MRVAILGGTGLIGAAVSQALVTRGDQVIQVVRSRRETPGPQVVWDAATTDGPAGVFAECDAVINLAGAPIARRWTDRAWQEIVTSRVDLSRRVATACAHDHVPVLLNGSAIGYYGAGEDAVDERSPAGAGRLADLCVQWEGATEPAVAAGLRVVRLRTGVVLARSGGALARMLTPARLGLGGPLGSGRQWFAWIHLADTVGLMLWALDRPLHGPVNVVTPGIVRQGEFAKHLGAVLHRPACLPTPGIALRLLLGEGADVVTEGRKVTSAVTTEGEYRFQFPEVGEALSDLVGAT